MALIGRHFSRDELLQMVADGLSLTKIAQVVTERLGLPTSRYYVTELLRSYGRAFRIAEWTAAKLHADKLGDGLRDESMDPSTRQHMADLKAFLAERKG